MCKAIAITLICLSIRAYGFDHSYEAWRGVLLKYVESGRVDYEHLAKDRAQIDEFIVECGQVPYAEYERWSREERQCFMINLNNAATIQLVLNSWRVNSFKHIGGAFSSPWNVEFIPLFGHVKALGNIEHEILPRSFHDPRVRFATVPASVGAPWLRSEPYLPERIEEQLEDQVRVFMKARPECNRYEGGVLKLSPLYDWYASEFGKRADVIAFVKKYYSTVADNPRIEYTKYDWSINAR